MKIKQGDLVIITSGKDKGKKGKVLRLFPRKDRVLVEGVNQFIRHLKPTVGRAGERKTLHRPIPVAKIAILNEKNQPDRVGYRLEKDGSKMRIFKKTGQLIIESKSTTRDKT